MSRPLRVLTVFGTRPEAVKLAPVIRALERSGRFESRVCTTGQHDRLLAQAMAALGLRADVALDAMVPGQSLGQLTARLYARLDTALEDAAPDWVLVQGDTTSAVVGAMCAYYRRVRVGHVEAGLRTGDRFSPFPEEVNRTTISRVADLHFAPTERARRNLEREGVPAGAIHVTGNTVVDALEAIRPRIAAEADAAVRARVEALGAGRLLLVTCHRRESFGAGLGRICAALARIAGRGDVSIAFVTHANPEARDPVRERLGGQARIALLEPVDYLTLLHLVERSHFILTDSGGIQEEAPSFGKPVLVLRAQTERPEAVEAGCARVVGTDEAAVVAAAAELLDDPAAYARMVPRANPFGDGKAGERIARAIAPA